MRWDDESERPSKRLIYEKGARACVPPSPSLPHLTLDGSSPSVRRAGLSGSVPTKTSVGRPSMRS
jgi:hypothetical protein